MKASTMKGLGSVPVGVLLDLCQAKVDHYDGTPPVELTLRTKRLKLSYSTLPQFAEAMGMTVVDLMDEMRDIALPGTPSIAEMPDCMTTMGVSDRKILEALDKMDQAQLRSMKRILGSWSSAWGFPDLGQFESTVEKIANVFIARIRSNAYPESPEAAEIETLLRDNIGKGKMFSSDELYKIIPYLDISPRWLYGFNSVSIWGYKKEAEDVYDLIKVFGNDRRRTALFALKVGGDDADQL
jgi:hypothetical protein